MTFIRNLAYRLFYRLKKPTVRITEAKLSGGGSLIDIRYWLSRPDRLDPDCNIYLTNDATGEKIYVLQIAKFGAVRTRHARHQHTGNVLLYNRNGLVEPGLKVTLHLDELSASVIVA